MDTPGEQKEVNGRGRDQLVDPLLSYPINRPSSSILFGFSEIDLSS